MNPDLITKAWNFAAKKHQGQLIPGQHVAYLRHVGNVAFEVMDAITSYSHWEYKDLMLPVAILHDVLEDTKTTFPEIVAEFGIDIAMGVLALTKIPYDSFDTYLQKIKQEIREIWVVKICDRIVNLQVPPASWSQEKIRNYLDSSTQIWKELQTDLPVSERLNDKILNYSQWVKKTGV